MSSAEAKIFSISFTITRICNKLYMYYWNLLSFLSINQTHSIQSPTLALGNCLPNSVGTLAYITSSVVTWQSRDTLLTREEGCRGSSNEIAPIARAMSTSLDRLSPSSAEQMRFKWLQACLNLLQYTIHKETESNNTATCLSIENNVTALHLVKHVLV